MRDLLSHCLTTITPFVVAEKYPVIQFGQTERVIQYVVNPKPNSKGMIEVQTMPDLADGGRALIVKVKQSTPIKRWHSAKRK